MLKKMFIEIRLCCIFLKGVTKSLVKFNVSTLNRLKIMGFFVNTKYIHKHNVIFDKTVTKPVTILTKCCFSISEPYKLP